ncbi:MAG: MATE family efflux transporter [Lachnospiraceae bacterium]
MQGTNIELLEHSPVPQAILKLSIPTVLSNIVSLLYNLTDTYFIGMLNDPVQLGAISLAFPVFMLIQAVGNVFGNGAPSYISRCLGAKRYDEVKRTSAVSVYVSSAATIVIGIAIFAFMNLILHLLGTSEANIGPTRAYLQVIVAFAVVIILQVILSSMLRAVGKVKEAVIGIIIGTVLNIVLDPVFILVFHQGVAGAAIATVIGNFVGVVYYIIVYIKGEIPLSIQPKDCRPSVRIFSEVLKIGLPNSVSVIIMSCSNIILNNLASDFGDHVVSAYGVSGKLIQMVFMIVVGYVTGYMPFAGYNYGAGNFRRMLLALKFTILSGTGVCLALLVPFVWLSPNFVGAFTTDAQIIDVGVRFLRAQAWAVPIMAVQTTMMVTFQATGQAIQAMTVNMGRQLLYNIPFLFLFSRLWGLNGLLYAQMAADYCTVITAVLIGIPLLRSLHQKSKQQTDNT